MPTAAARPTPKKPTLRKETLRRLTPSELRAAAGGRTKCCTYHKSGCVG
jgi:hypothetical protein